MWRFNGCPKIHLCWGLNSHCFHIIGDKLINPIISRVYIPIISISVIQGGMSLCPKKRDFWPVGTGGETGDADDNDTSTGEFLVPLLLERLWRGKTWSHLPREGNTQKIAGFQQETGGIRCGTMCVFFFVLWRMLMKCWWLSGDHFLFSF